MPGQVAEDPCRQIGLPKLKAERRRKSKLPTANIITQRTIILTSLLNSIR